MGVLKSTERSRVGGGVVVQPAWGWVAEGAASERTRLASDRRECIQKNAREALQQGPQEAVR